MKWFVRREKMQDFFRIMLGKASGDSGKYAQFFYSSFVLSRRYTGSFTISARYFFLSSGIAGSINKGFKKSNYTQMGMRVSQKFFQVVEKTLEAKFSITEEEREQACDCDVKINSIALSFDKSFFLENSHFLKYLIHYENISIVSN